MRRFQIDSDFAGVAEHTWMRIGVCHYARIVLCFDIAMPIQQ